MVKESNPVEILNLISNDMPATVNNKQFTSNISLGNFPGKGNKLMQQFESLGNMSNLDATIAHESKQKPSASDKKVLRKDMFEVQGARLPKTSKISSFSPEKSDHLPPKQKTVLNDKSFDHESKPIQSSKTSKSAGELTDDIQLSKTTKSDSDLTADKPLKQVLLQKAKTSVSVSDMKFSTHQSEPVKLRKISKTESHLRKVNSISQKDKAYSNSELNAVVKQMEPILSTVAKISMLKEWKEKQGKSNDDVLRKVIGYLIKVGDFIKSKEETTESQKKLFWAYVSKSLTSSKSGADLLGIYDLVSSEFGFTT